MALDFALAHPTAHFVATEREKLEYFCGQRAVERALLPGKTYSAKSPSSQTRRYFIEKYPIFLDRTDDATSPLASFCYVDEGVLSNSGFTSFLKRYGPLFAALGRFRLVYVAAEHRPFRRAERAFDRFTEALANPEAATPGGQMGEYFRLRRLFETRQYRQLNKAKLDRLRDLSQRFRQPAADSRFQQWAKAVETKTRSGRIDAQFEAYRSRHSYDIFGTHPGPGSAA